MTTKPLTTARWTLPFMGIRQQPTPPQPKQTAPLAPPIKVVREVGKPEEVKTDAKN
jgi:hypothetical protein